MALKIDSNHQPRTCVTTNLIKFKRKKTYSKITFLSFIPHLSSKYIIPVIYRFIIDLQTYCGSIVIFVP